MARCWAVLAGIGCVAVGACRTSTEPLRDLGPVPNGAFTTDATGDVVRRFLGAGDTSNYRFTVISRFENRGTATLYLGRCFPTSAKPLYGADVADSPTTESAYVMPWMSVGHDMQFEIVPGAVRIDTLELVGPSFFTGDTHKPIGVTEGKFRLYFDLRLAPGDGAVRATASLQLSNAFVVRTSD